MQAQRQPQSAHGKLWGENGPSRVWGRDCQVLTPLCASLYVDHLCEGRDLGRGSSMQQKQFLGLTREGCPQLSTFSSWVTCSLLKGNVSRAHRVHHRMVFYKGVVCISVRGGGGGGERERAINVRSSDEKGDFPCFQFNWGGIRVFEHKVVLLSQF